MDIITLVVFNYHIDLFSQPSSSSFSSCRHSSCNAGVGLEQSWAIAIDITLFHFSVTKGQTKNQVFDFALPSTDLKKPANSFGILSSNMPAECACGSVCLD
jgi:hypothetical protein